MYTLTLSNNLAIRCHSARHKILIIQKAQNFFQVVHQSKKLWKNFPNSEIDGVINPRDICAEVWTFGSWAGKRRQRSMFWREWAYVICWAWCDGRGRIPLAGKVVTSLAGENVTAEGCRHLLEMVWRQRGDVYFWQAWDVSGRSHLLVRLTAEGWNNET